MINWIFKLLESTLGKTVAYVVVFTILGGGLGITVNSMYTQIQNNIQSNSISIVQLEKSNLIEERYDLEEEMYELELSGEIVKPRTRNRLNEVIDRLKVLSAREEDLLKQLGDVTNE